MAEAPPDSLISNFITLVKFNRIFKKKLGVGSGIISVQYRPLSSKGDIYKFSWELQNDDQEKIHSDNYVVKFTPPQFDEDPWYDVKREFMIISKLFGTIPVPEPICDSNAYEKDKVGTNFMITKYVKGHLHSSISDVPKIKREKAMNGVMEILAELHSQQCNWWVGKLKEKAAAVSGKVFWEEEISKWSQNVLKVTRKDSSTADFCDELTDLEAPRRNTGMVHGNLTISDIIFDHDYKIKAILNWKYTKNGDPLVDVAYWMMIYLRPSQYGLPNFHCSPLTVDEDDEDTPAEETLLSCYKTKCLELGGEDFSRKTLAFAKAVTCLRLISVYKAADEDDFQGHSLERFPTLIASPSTMIDFLLRAGREFQREFES